MRYVAAVFVVMLLVPSRANAVTHVNCVTRKATNTSSSVNLIRSGLAAAVAKSEKK